MTQAEIAAAEKTQTFSITIGGEAFALNLEDLVITSESHTISAMINGFVGSRYHFRVAG